MSESAFILLVPEGELGSVQYSRERKKFSLRNTEDTVLFSIISRIATEKSRNNLILFYL